MENLIYETQRLKLRKYREDDLTDLYEYLSDEEVVRFEPYPPFRMDQMQNEIAWRISSDEMIAVELKAERKLIGNVYMGKRDFNAMEIGYVFNRKYWGCGYAKEACEAMIRKAFADGVHRIFAECDPYNPHSWKLLESLGFAREAHLKQNIYFKTDNDGNPIWKDTYIYALLNSSETV